MIHVDNYEEDHNLRRGSSQITVVDPFHPAVQQRNQQPQQVQQQLQNQVQSDQQPLQQNNVPSRKSSLVDSYSRTASLEQYQSFEDQYSPYTQRSRNSEPPVPPTRRVSLRLSPGSPEPRVNILDTQEEPIAISELQEEKPIPYIQTEPIKETKTLITAQQRWLWAYNKIIMQLDVSTFYFIYYFRTW